MLELSRLEKQREALLARERAARAEAVHRAHRERGRAHRRHARRRADRRRRADAATVDELLAEAQELQDGPAPRRATAPRKRGI